MSNIDALRAHTDAVAELIAANRTIESLYESSIVAGGQIDCLLRLVKSLQLERDEATKIVGKLRRQAEDKNDAVPVEDIRTLYDAYAYASAGMDNAAEFPAVRDWLIAQVR